MAKKKKAVHVFKVGDIVYEKSGFWGPATGPVGKIVKLLNKGMEIPSDGPVPSYKSRFVRIKWATQQRNGLQETELPEILLASFEDHVDGLKRAYDTANSRLKKAKKL